MAPRSSAPRVSPRGLTHVSNPGGVTGTRPWIPWLPQSGTYARTICFAYLSSGEKLTGSVRGQGLALDDATGGTTTDSISVVAAVLVSLVFLAIFVLLVAAMWRIFTKAGEAGWKSLIPIWNLIVLLRIAGRPAWWLLLFLVPLVNIVVAIIMYVDLAKAFGKGIGFALGMIFLSVIFLPILAFGDAQYRGRVARLS